MEKNSLNQSIVSNHELKSLVYDMDEIMKLVKQLTQIAAPTFLEKQRAQFVKEWLQEKGIPYVYVDKAGNIVFPVSPQFKGKCTVISAHLDTVFEEEEIHVKEVSVSEMYEQSGNIAEGFVSKKQEQLGNIVEGFISKRQEQGRQILGSAGQHTKEQPKPRIQLQAPGIGDNSVNAAMLMYAAWKYWEKVQQTGEESSIIFLWNVCEEGLGNLKGIRYFMEHFSEGSEGFDNKTTDKTERKSIGQVIALDLYYDKLTTGSVGSKRYEITVKTPGGHSYIDYGNANAIFHLSQIITGLYEIEVPTAHSMTKDNTNYHSNIGNNDGGENNNHQKTTYNVGMIEGGTSVNTIAQHAKMLYEIRSVSKEHMEQVEKRMITVLEREQTKYKEDGVVVEWEIIGERPCMGEVDERLQRELAKLVQEVIRQHTGKYAEEVFISTDCNIPLAMGIPAVSFGVSLGGGAHTRQEWIWKDSLETGWKILWDVILRIYKEDIQLLPTF